MFHRIFKRFTRSRDAVGLAKSQMKKTAEARVEASGKMQEMQDRLLRAVMNKEGQADGAE